jgi:protein subunit release factor B
MRNESRERLFSVTKKDLIIQTFCCDGNGGQNVNKVETGVRIIHKDSGTVVESREERTQGQNKKIAFRRLVEAPSFKLWVNRRANEIIKGKTIEQEVEEMMSPDKLKIEFRDESGKWVDEKSLSE